MKLSAAVLAFIVSGSALAADRPLPVSVSNVPLSVRGAVTDADAGKYTHVGQKPDRVVNLAFYQVDTNFFIAPFRIDPVTGAPEATQFRVPAGFVFVLTDVQGRMVCRVGIVNEFYLYASTPPYGQVMRDWSGELTCPEGGNGRLERHYGTGLVFSAGTSLWVAVDSLETVLWAQGYLVPAG
jgi:hypothetical protein